mmetsp:Transcript_36427/g.74782  ORF Transcript_36427/g.74782 Transcript_36427/m.74782 type:complete len:212 (-) Transcript_36427:67-702(-)
MEAVVNADLGTVSAVADVVSDHGPPRADRRREANRRDGVPRKRGKRSRSKADGVEDEGPVEDFLQVLHISLPLPIPVLLLHRAHLRSPSSKIEVLPPRSELLVLRCLLCIQTGSSFRREKALSPCGEERLLAEGSRQIAGARDGGRSDARSEAHGGGKGQSIVGSRSAECEDENTHFYIPSLVREEIWFKIKISLQLVSTQTDSDPGSPMD